MSLLGPILRGLAKNAFRTMMTDDRRSYRGIDLIVAALHVAEYIEAKSSTKTVGIVLPTGGGFPVVALACWFLGRIPVPMNYMLGRDELQYIIDDCGTDIVFTAQPMLDYLGFEPERVNCVRLETLDFTGVPEFRWPARIEDDEIGALLYTSGTTGKPKGVMLTHANLVCNLRQFGSAVSFTKDDLMLGVLPQFHSFGMTVLTLQPLAGPCGVVYTARFVPAQILRLFREHRPTVFVGLPTMYNALLRAKDATPEDFESLRLAVSGGEPLPEAVFNGFKDRFGITITEGYGLTETSPVTHYSPTESSRRHSVGRPMPGLEQRIVCVDTERDLGPGGEGEIRVRGGNVMRGYFGLPDSTAAVFDRRGFFRTGDIGKVDDEGYLYITGRLKEMLIVGGENVFPREIEEVLDQHDAVIASAVVGRSDPMRGEVPVAFVEICEDHEFDEDALRAHCRERLAGYKVPKEVIRIDELPRNATGKIMRRELVCEVPA